DSRHTAGTVRSNHGGDHEMATLSETLRQVLSSYAGEMLNGYSYLTTNADGTVFVIIGLGSIGDQHFVDTSLVARLTGTTIVIEYDTNNKPLIEALLADGIPRDQIILAYAGESRDAAA
ncbi:MAG: hypothetical protein ACRDGS_10070, partial [Chloroflexota bacterium]